MARLSCLAVMLMSLAAPTAVAQRLPLNAEDYLADTYAMMRDFGRCSAFYTHLAQGHELGGWREDAETRRGHAREARVAAETAFAGMEAPANASAEELRKVEAQIAAYTRSLESIIALEAARQRAFAERNKFDAEPLNFCWRKRALWLAADALQRQGIVSGN